MAIDNDLAALMPQPPPPRPARRDAAIEEAMRRFDAGGPAAPAPPVSARPAPARGAWGRPQIAALASAAVVVMVSVPVWWAERDRTVPQVQAPGSPHSSAVDIAPAPRVPQQAAPAGPPPAEAERALPAAPVARTPTPPPPPVAVDALPAPAALADARSAAEASAPASASARPAPPPPQAAGATRPVAARAESSDRIVVTGARIQRQDYNSATPVVAAEEALLTEGDWNTCTLLDPRRDVGACRAFADPAARGAAGRAGAQLADGLTLAWQGELDRAIAAFDRAIAASPDLSIAYLNRGLAYQEKGDLRRALADFDRAVANDPGGARGYYHRSLLHRAKGDSARANADARRAIGRDPAYEAALPGN